MDNTDRKILLEVQKDGRLSVSDLAEKIALSQSPCARRLKHLESSGVITGYRAMIDRNKIGLRITSFVGAKLGTHKEQTVNEFENAIQTMCEVINCHVVSGQFDYLLEVVTEDMEAHESFLRKLLAATDVKELQSCFAMRTIKSVAPIPI